MDTLIGKTIGQYTILEEIGRGGMATVYSAMQLSMNRKVAIKILPQHFLHDKHFLARFKREVEVIAHLEHPHILPIFDFGEVDGMPFIAMRYLGGDSLAQYLRRIGSMSLEAIEKPLTQIAQALDHAHQQGIIHRDLKPGNILLDESGNAYLSDFGIARVLGSNLTGTDNIIGTPAYMSPEQAHGLPIDARSDVYALGVVLFELITGREPFYAETPMGLLLLHINEPLPPIRQFGKEVSDEIQAVVDKATEKDADRRFSSAGDMARAYSAALRGETLETRAARPSPVREAQTLLPVKLENVGGTVVAGSHMTTAAREAATIPAPTVENASDAPIQPVRRMPYLVGGGGGFIVIMVAILAVLGVFNPPDNTLSVPAVPTPFRSAVSIMTDDYTISMPQRWLPGDVEYTDASDINRLLHIWQADDHSAFVTLAISDMAYEEYLERYYATQEHLQFVDDATADDGTIRRSYRLIDERDGFGTGQMDVFFQQQGASLVVLELYTADSIAADETVLTTLQLILDSLRVVMPAARG